MSKPIDIVLEKLKSYRKTGKGWQACCPAHDDKSPSLQIKETEGGKVLVHCFAGCDTGDVLSAMGLQYKDLFSESLSIDARIEYQRTVIKAAKADLVLVQEGAKTAEKNGKLSQEDSDYLEQQKARVAQEERKLIHLERSSNAVITKWPTPQPLTAKLMAEPYPLDALPDEICKAVIEAQSFVQSPIAMVASCAMSALSLACQAHIDVKRGNNLKGPVSLFQLVLGESGERKSSTDNMFSAPIQEYERQQAELFTKPLNDYQAEFEAWSAQIAGVKEAIKSDAKKEKGKANELKARLCELQNNQPIKPRVPELLRADTTPEALAYNLAMAYPSAGIMSAEAGIVFGSHGMGKDSVTRNLSLLNMLWDGGTLKIDRRTAESFKVEGARLSISLQVQQEVIRQFQEQAGDIARGSGFFARFLMVWPESTQGTRLYKESPETLPALAAFHRRITAILNDQPDIDYKGRLSTQLVTLSNDAKAVWIAFHNAVEVQLKTGGELQDVRDVASKIADNAARIAALFQWYEGGYSVSRENMERATLLAAWHLQESRRFFGELALPVELANAARIEKWILKALINTSEPAISKNRVRQYGPVRDKAKLEAAITELQALGRLRTTMEGRAALLEVNPALLSEVA